MKSKEQTLGDKLRGKEAELAGLTEELKGTKVDASGLKERAAALRALVDGLKTEKEGLGNELRGKEQKLAQLGGELEKTKAKASGLEKKAGYLKGQVEELKQKEGALGQELKGKEGQLAALKGDLENTKAKAKGLEQKTGQLKGQLASLDDELQKTKSEASELQQDLKKAKKFANRRQELAKRIKDHFTREGVKADVDMASGDVTINFGKEYFETDKSKLKVAMKNILNKAIPAYAQSLFDDPNIAKKIEAIEIIGFASPTYNGKLVNPVSLKPADRTAVNYNMDLSYKRAKSIFEYIFDLSKLRYKHQKAFLPLVQVTGKSYLSEEIKAEMGSMTREEYCEKYDCNKSQKVIIKFNLED